MRGLLLSSGSLNMRTRLVLCLKAALLSPGPGPAVLSTLFGGNREPAQAKQIPRSSTLDNRPLSQTQRAK